MSHRAIYVDGFYRHASLSPAVLTDRGILHVSGQMAMDINGVVIGQGEIAVQLERVWFQIKSIVDAAGGTLADIVRITAWTTSLDYVDAIKQKREEMFAGLTPPASAMVTVAALVRPGALVEIDAVADISSGSH